jgi:hypothetical protein
MTRGMTTKLITPKSRQLRRNRENLKAIMSKPGEDKTKLDLQVDSKYLSMSRGQMKSTLNKLFHGLQAGHAAHNMRNPLT